MQDYLATRRAREMRREPTKAEGILWSLLRGKQLNVKFRRQFPVGPYIADFACVEKSLVMETDGWSHDDRGEYDRERDTFFEHEGWRVVRFGNLDVLKNTDDVVREIERHLASVAPT